MFVCTLYLLCEKFVLCTYCWWRFCKFDVGLSGYRQGQNQESHRVAKTPQIPNVSTQNCSFLLGWGSLAGGASLKSGGGVIHPWNKSSGWIGKLGGEWCVGFGCVVFFVWAGSLFVFFVFFVNMWCFFFFFFFFVLHLWYVCVCVVCLCYYVLKCIFLCSCHFFIFLHVNWLAAIRVFLQRLFSIYILCFFFLPALNMCVCVL